MKILLKIRFGFLCCCYCRHYCCLLVRLFGTHSNAALKLSGGDGCCCCRCYGRCCCCNVNVDFGGGYSVVVLAQRLTFIGLLTVVVVAVALLLVYGMCYALWISDVLNPLDKVENAQCTALIVVIYTRLSCFAVLLVVMRSPACARVCVCGCMCALARAVLISSALFGTLWD